MVRLECGSGPGLRMGMDLTGAMVAGVVVVGGGVAEVVIVVAVVVVVVVQYVAVK